MTPLTHSCVCPSMCMDVPSVCITASFVCPHHVYVRSGSRSIPCSVPSVLRVDISSMCMSPPCMSPPCMSPQCMSPPCMSPPFMSPPCHVYVFSFVCSLCMSLRFMCMTFREYVPPCEYSLCVYVLLSCICLFHELRTYVYSFVLYILVAPKKWACFLIRTSASGRKNLISKQMQQLYRRSEFILPAYHCFFLHILNFLGYNKLLNIEYIEKYFEVYLKVYYL